MTAPKIDWGKYMPYIGYVGVIISIVFWAGNFFGKVNTEAEEFQHGFTDIHETLMAIEGKVDVLGADMSEVKGDIKVLKEQEEHAENDRNEMKKLINQNGLDTRKNGERIRDVELNPQISASALQSITTGVTQQVILQLPTILQGMRVNPPVNNVTPVVPIIK